ncbi:MAG: 50S ribosomal protein L29 [Alphaproteobacteria bacterium MarineAlpha9_Bin2]|nr:MAG: 50S ribosomal protein L29 [Alphaproteobacteria bacterium MarineAlpha9_Bin1]PPR30502.1 MAG: 50S ribosomal protein L29 [Alphaproteobacteria bacterium MarineAlpha9_Bin2]
MKYSDVKQKTDDELKLELRLLNKEQFNLRFQKSSGQLENLSKIRKTRRDIARINTSLVERKVRDKNA